MRFREEVEDAGESGDSSEVLTVQALPTHPLPYGNHCSLQSSYINVGWYSVDAAEISKTEKGENT